VDQLRGRIVLECIDLLKNDKVGYYIAATVAAITAILQLLKKTDEYFEKLYVTRKLVRYSALIESCCENTLEHKFLTKLKSLEAFTIATNINTTPRKSNFIMMLYIVGRSTIKDLKQVHTFFEVSDNEKAIPNFSTSNKLEVIWSGLAALFINIVFISLLMTITPHNINQFLGYLAVVSLYLLLMYGIGEPIRKAITYRKFLKILKSDDLLEKLPSQPANQLE
jgi:hypothetical protein